MKARAILYGTLLVVATLFVLHERADMTAHVHTLTGSTAQGSRVEMLLSGRHLSSFQIGGIGANCRGLPRAGVSWSPTVGQKNVSYREHDSRFDVHEWPDPDLTHPPGVRPNAYMRARLNWDAHRVVGVIIHSETGARGACASGPIAFSASR